MANNISKNIKSFKVLLHQGYVEFLMPSVTEITLQCSNNVFIHVIVLSWFIWYWWYRSYPHICQNWDCGGTCITDTNIFEQWGLILAVLIDAVIKIRLFMFIYEVILGSKCLLNILVEPTGNTVSDVRSVAGCILQTNPLYYHVLET